MATLARWQRTIVNELGNVLAGASVQVNNESSGALAALFSDRAGTLGIGNPFLADSTGFAAFHVAGGSYKITVTSGSFTQTWRYVGVGTNQEVDTTTQLTSTTDVGFDTPENYGAVGDGIANDTTALQAAIDACRNNNTTLLLRRHYGINATIVIKSSLVIQGSAVVFGGRNGWIDPLAGFPATSDIIYMRGDEANYLQSTRIQGITIGNAARRGRNALVIDTMDGKSFGDLSIDSCTFLPVNGRSILHINNMATSNGGMFLSSFSNNNFFNGVQTVMSGSDNVFRDNWFHTDVAGDPWIWSSVIQGGLGPAIVDNLMEGAGFVRVDGGAQTLIVFNRIEASLVGGGANNSGALIQIRGGAANHTVMTITGAANNGSGLIRLTMASTSPLINGDVVLVEDVRGTVEANGVWRITGITGTTMDLVGSAFVNAFIAGASPAPTATHASNQIAGTVIRENALLNSVNTTAVTDHILLVGVTSGTIIDDNSWYSANSTQIASGHWIWNNGATTTAISEIQNFQPSTVTAANAISNAGTMLSDFTGSNTLVNGLNSNINPSSNRIRIVGPSAAFSVGGFQGGYDGRRIRIYCTVAFAMTIVNEDASSTAANRIKTLTGANVTLRAGTSFATLAYDITDARWILEATN